MKKVIKYVILSLLVIWILANFVTNFLTVRVNVDKYSWSAWSADGSFAEPSEREPQWEEYTLKRGDRVEFETYYDLYFEVTDIDLFSITVKCEPALSKKSENKTFSLEGGRRYYIIPLNEIVELVTPSADSGEIFEIEFLGFY